MLPQNIADVIGGTWTHKNGGRCDVGFSHLSIGRREVETIATTLNKLHVFNTILSHILITSKLHLELRFYRGTINPE